MDYLSVIRRTRLGLPELVLLVARSSWVLVGFAGREEDWISSARTKQTTTLRNVFL